MVPAFVDVGQPDMVLPDGIHEATPDEVYAALVAPFPHSTTREDIFAGWSAWSRSIRSLVPVEVEFLDGSFVTNRENPNDVDVSIWIRSEDIEALPRLDQFTLSNLLDNGNAKKSFRCDAYLVPKCPQSHPNWALFEKQRRWTRGHWKAYKDPEKNIVEGVVKGFVSVGP